MKHGVLLIAMMWAVDAWAAVPYHDKMIAAIAKKTDSTRAEVLESLKTGCDSGKTQYMAKCGMYHAVAADIQLNTVYEKLLTQLTDWRAKETLPKAQQAWFAFRDKNCEFDASGSEGGTGHSIQVYGCKKNMADNRTKELKEYLQCGFPGCPY